MGEFDHLLRMKMVHVLKTTFRIQAILHFAVLFQNARISLGNSYINISVLH